MQLFFLLRAGNPLSSACCVFNEIILKLHVAENMKISLIQTHKQKETGGLIELVCLGTELEKKDELQKTEEFKPLFFFFLQLMLAFLLQVCVSIIQISHTDQLMNLNRIR